MRQVSEVCNGCPELQDYVHNIRCTPVVTDGMHRMFEDRPEVDIDEVPPECPRFLEHLVLRQKDASHQ